MSIKLMIHNGITVHMDFPSTYRSEPEWMNQGWFILDESVHEIFFFKRKDITGLRRGFLIIIDFGGSVVFSCCGSRLILLYVNEARSGNWFRKLLNQDSEPVKRKNRTLNTGQNIENENLNLNGPRKTIKFRR